MRFLRRHALAKPARLWVRFRVCFRVCLHLRSHVRSAVVMPLILAGIVACSTPELTAPPQVVAPAVPAVPFGAPSAPLERYVQANGAVLGRNQRLLIYEAAAGDRLAGIATRFLGDAALGWTVAEANAIGVGADSSETLAGRVLIVPLQPRNAVGVSAEQYQTVPILCYHRFGSPSSKMIISPASFAAQLDWLARNHFQVLRLADLAGFLAGHKPLPPRSVVITIDDGYESVYRHAYPLLKKYGFPATLFVYTDFIGAGDAISWAQMQEMSRSGLVDVQSHSKSHRNLIERGAQESEARYRQNIDIEMRQPRELIAKRLDGRALRHIAYPYGDANVPVLEAATRAGFELGVTVIPGGNAFFAQPMMLRRTMIFGDLDLEGFKARLQTSRVYAAPAVPPLAP